MARLIVAEGPWKGIEVALEGGEYVVGRDPSCDLALPDGALSRQHLRLWAEGEHWLVEDLDSRNGTLLDGKPLERTQLRGGESLVIGRNVLVFEHGAPSSLLVELDAETSVVPVDTDPEGAAGRALGALLELADALASASSSHDVEARTVAWLLAQCGAPRALVFQRRGGRLVSDCHYTPAGQGATRHDAPAVELGAGAARASALDGKALWVSRAGRAGGSIVVPVGTPAELLIELVGAPARPERDELRRIACAGQLAAGHVAARRRIEELSARVQEFEGGGEPAFVVNDPAMAEIEAFVERAAGTDAIVLLLGESGSGKEVLARELHRRSERKDRTFVSVNCAAIPATLLESELFGHERGAFTGAVARRSGRFEAADKGTLLLDEIGELSASAQAALLRILEERTLVRLGGTRPVPIDVRIIAATHRDLAADVAAGRFRHDLYFRLSVLVAKVPPLRERPGDIASLARHFLATFKARARRPLEGLEPAALAALTAYAWPGNVRELRNVIERAVILGRGPTIGVADLPAEVRGGTATTPVDAIVPLAELERRAILAALEATSGNKAQAARLLGIDRMTLYNRLEKLGEPAGD